MKINTLLLFIIGLATTSCLKDKNFPDNPVLKAIDLDYKEIGGLQEDDSLIINLRFQDGNGDLGFDATDEKFTTAPFNEFDYYSYNPSTQVVTKFSLDNLRSDIERDLELVRNMIKVSDNDLPGLDTLPPYTFPYTCDNWQEVKLGANGTVLIEDTVYYTRNLRYNNIYVDFFVENNSGEFEEFFWEYSRAPQCNIAYHGRFPIINDPDNEAPVEGSIRYSIPNKGWRLTFGDKKFKIKVRILDRAGNISNTIESDTGNLDDFLIN